MKFRKWMVVGVALILALSLTSCVSNSLRNFSDEIELTEWREKVGIVDSGVSWVKDCLELQDIGLKDGYKVSADIDIYGDEVSISCTVIAGSFFYQIFPDELEVYMIYPVY